MDGSILRELHGLLDALGQHIGGSVAKTPVQSIRAVRQTLFYALTASLRDVPGVACQLFGDHDDHKVEVSGVTGKEGVTEILRARPTTGTHEIVVTIARVPMAGHGGSEDPMTLGHVASVMESVTERIVMLERAEQLARDADLPGQISESVTKDRETYELVVECLEFLRELLDREMSKPASEDSPASE